MWAVHLVYWFNFKRTSSFYANKGRWHANSFFFFLLVFLGLIFINSYIILLSKHLSNKTWLIIIVRNLSSLPQYLTVVMTVSTVEVLHLATDKVACQVWRQWCQKMLHDARHVSKQAMWFAPENAGLRKHFLLKGLERETLNQFKLTNYSLKLCFREFRQLDVYY